MLCIRLFDPLLVKLIYMLPQRAGRLILTAILIAAFLDGLGSLAAVLQMHYFLGRAAFEVSGRLYGLSSFLENALTERIRRRMVKAYPSLKERKRAENGGIDEKTAVFARGCCFYKLAMLFFIGAFLGDITETIFCYTRTGIIMSRSSVVYGPFSIVWGLGCVLLTAFLYPYRKMTVISFLRERSLEELTNTYAVYFQSLCSARYSGITAPFPLIWEAVSICCIVFSGGSCRWSG